MVASDGDAAVGGGDGGDDGGPSCSVGVGGDVEELGWAAGDAVGEAVVADYCAG